MNPSSCPEAFQHGAGRLEELHARSHLPGALPETDDVRKKVIETY